MFHLPNQPTTSSFISNPPSQSPSQPDPQPPAYTLITTFRFSVFSSTSGPISSDPLPSPLTSLPTHITRLHNSAAAASWKFHPSTFWGSQTSPSLVTYLSSAISASISSTYPDASPSEDFRVRLDLSPPSDGGELKVTVGETAPLPAYRGFNPLEPERLPRPNELLGMEAAGSEGDSGENPGDVFIPPMWNLVLNAKPTTPTFHTRWKTSERGVYEDARRGYDLGTEVLLWSDGSEDDHDHDHDHDPEIMDGTISSVYFFRDGQWVTPRAEAGGLRSVSRELALQRGLAVEGRVRVRSLREGEVVWCGNGLRGFGWGRLDLVDSEGRDVR